MKKTIKYLAIVICVVIGADIIFSFGIEKLLSKGCIYSLEGTNDLSSDILIIGASRGVHHYDPQLLSGRLQSKVQVLGRPSENILFNYTIFKAILDKTEKKPQIVILELSESDFNSEINHSHVDDLSVLYPFFYSEPAIREVLSDVLGDTELFLLKYSGLYRNNSKLYPYLKYIISRETVSVIVGFSPLNGIWTKPIKEKFEIGNLDPVKIKYFDKFIELCKSENIQLVFTMSPSYRILRGKKWKDFVRTRATEQGIELIDHEEDSTFLSHHEWFYDSYHLNNIGVKKYCDIVVEELEQKVLK